MQTQFNDKNALWTNALVGIIGLLIGAVGVFIAYADYKKPSDIELLIDILANNPDLSEKTIAFKTSEFAKEKKPIKISKINTTSSNSDSVTAACIMIAAENYEIPPQIIIGVYHVNYEKYKNNKLESHKIGFMGIPKVTLEELALKWSMSKEKATGMIVNDKCTAINVAGWFLSKNHTIGMSYKDTIKLYNASDEKSNSEFYKEVIAKLKDLNLLKD